MEATLRLTDIRIGKFEILNTKHEGALDDNKYEFEFSNTVTLNDEQKIIRSELSINLFEIEDANTKSPLAELALITVLVLENFGEIVLRESDQLNVPNALLAFINNLVVNNARGVLVAKLENTIYSNAILPLVPPNASNREGYTLFPPSKTSNPI